MTPPAPQRDNEKKSRMPQPIILEPDGPPADLEALARLLADIVRNILIRRQQAKATQKKAA